MLGAKRKRFLSGGRNNYHYFFAILFFCNSFLSWSVCSKTVRKTYSFFYSFTSCTVYNYSLAVKTKKNSWGPFLQVL